MYYKDFEKLMPDKPVEIIRGLRPTPTPRTNNARQVLLHKQIGFIKEPNLHTRTQVWE